MLVKNGGKMRMSTEVRSFMTGVDVFRKGFKEMKSQQIYMLLLVAEREGIDQIDFQKILGAPAGTVSRNLSRLGIMTKDDKDFGYRLIDVLPNPHNSRSNQVFLSKKGREFIEKLSSKLGDNL
jgi:DNA-binding MarR family transcriptional regulator